MNPPRIPELHMITPRRTAPAADDDRRRIAELCVRIEELYCLQAELGARLAALEGVVLASKHNK
jgi:hypothetical protein